MIILVANIIHRKLKIRRSRIHSHARVFGVRNSEFGEEVKAVVQPVDMASLTFAQAELIAYARDQIYTLCPRSIDGGAPRHPTGKLEPSKDKAEDAMPASKRSTTISPESLAGRRRTAVCSLGALKTPRSAA